MEDCLSPKSKSCLSPKAIIDAGGYHLLFSRIFSILGLLFIILGIISDAKNAALGLESISLFLLAISFLVASITPCLGWMVAVYLRNPQKNNPKVANRYY